MTRVEDCAQARRQFEGHSVRECGEHRTVGPHRAWCFDCTEWCYPDLAMACKGCELPAVRALAERLQREMDQRWAERNARILELADQVERLQRELDEARA